MLSIKESAIDFLITNKNKIINEWNEQILSPEDPFSDKNSLHFEHFIELLIQSFMHKDAHTDKMIKQLAHIVAAERIQAKTPFVDFINHVSSGRAILIHHLLLQNMSSAENQSILKLVNSCIDQFLYDSISYYTELNSELNMGQCETLSQTHKERLTLLGKMTSSFVHEFRNPLTSIMGFIQLLQAETPDIKYLDIISSELQQLNSRITQFLDISKKETNEAEKHIFNIGHLIYDVIEFLYPSILEVNAKVTTNLADNIFISGSKEEFRQVLLNIILNALDVLSFENSNPIINISTTEEISKQLTMNISNNGQKIQEDIIRDIFKPFITTKERGTGLGLFVCKEIIEKNQGSLSCSSNDELTTFTIRIPCV
ncbi:histidine kinase N-terminal domain-containing protein [Bacillus cihuensis]|uniref:histidine kinase N-terminal domain-containing protein n=1 Tax=Bacillus cihuensis TaxID=1208599 RepID=UPI000411DA02|nr:histidine kinase N-terminal domain-containing protein [Bacillus cihuensis]